MKPLITRLVLAGLLALSAPALVSAGPFCRTRAEADAVVDGWYQRYLRRDADPMAACWADRLRQGEAPEKVLACILASSEYYRLAGNCPTGYVSRLYGDLQGRQASPDEVRYWAGKLACGMPRERIVCGLLQGAAPAPQQPVFNPPVFNQPAYNPPAYPPQGFDRPRQPEYEPPVPAFPVRGVRIVTRPAYR